MHNAAMPFVTRSQSLVKRFEKAHTFDKTNEIHNMYYVLRKKGF